MLAMFYLHIFCYVQMFMCMCVFVCVFVYVCLCLQKETGTSICQQLDSTPKSSRTQRSKTPRRRRRQEIIKLRTEMNQVETKRIIERINRNKSWFFEKINKIDKPLGRLMRGHRECVEISYCYCVRGNVCFEL